MSRGLVAFVLVLVTASSARAQDVFSTPGRPRLTPTGESFGTAFFGEDDDGFVYYALGSLACHAPGAPDEVHTLSWGQFHDANGSLIGAQVFAAASPDGDGVDVAVAPIYPAWQKTNLEAVRLFHVRCAELAPLGDGIENAPRVGGTLLRSDDPLLSRLAGPRFVRVGDAWCFTASDRPTEEAAPHEPIGIVCIDPSTPAPTFTLLADARAFDAILDVDPAFGALGLGGTAYHGWMLGGLAAARDGRIFFVADRYYRTAGAPAITATWTYVVERLADGTVRARFGPVPTSASWNPLRDLGAFVYSAALDAMVAVVTGQEHNWAAFADGSSYGWTGVGLRVIPLDAPGVGYLPLSRGVAPLLNCDAQIPFCGQLGRTAVFARGDGLQLAVVRLTDNPNVPAIDIFDLTFDADGLDLDDDGLSAAEERAAGTWDTMPDSDGGGTPDNIEVAYARTDPLSTADEPARRHEIRGEIRYVPSPLLGWHIGDAGGFWSERPRTTGGDAPLCSGGTCYGPGGVPLARYPSEREIGGTGPVTSADGAFVMLQTAEGLVRFYFADGREELAVGAATLDTYVKAWAPDALRVIPIDPTRTIIACDGAVEPARYPARIVLADGSDLRVLYDHAQAQRDSGLDIADGDRFSPTSVGVMASIGIIGWNADSARLHVSVRGNWDSWLMTVSLDGSVDVLARGRALQGINTLRWDRLSSLPSLLPPPAPTYLLPTGHGDYLASGAVMEPFGGFLPAHTTRISNHIEMPPLAIWGDTFVEEVCCGFVEDGLYELVRYELTVDPGDVLFMVAGDSGAMLSKSGPRGGLVDLWPEPLADIRDVGGLDLAPDSWRLCVADRRDGVVWELEPSGPGGVPDVIRYVADVPGVLDCAYDPDGTLRVLANGPARVELRDGDFGDMGVAQTLPAALEPIELTRKPDGSLEVRVRDGLRGRAYLPDGRVLSMKDDDMVLRIDDVPVPAGDFGERLVYQSADIDYGPAHPARVAFAVRADGAIVLAPHDGETRPPFGLVGKLSLVDVVAGINSPLAVGDVPAAEGIGLVVVPGGSAADPWTGRLPPVPPGIEPPGAPSVDEAPPPDRAPDDSGCAAGLGPELIGLLIAAAAIRQRGRVRSNAAR